MSNPLARRAPASTGAGERPNDGAPYRPDYPYSVEGHVEWLNSYFAFRGRKDRWRVIDQMNGSRSVRTFEKVSTLGTDDWEREQRRPPTVPNKRPQLHWMADA